MMAKIGRELILVDSYDREIKALGPAAEGEDPDVTASREDFEDKLARANKTIKDIDAFHGHINKHWTMVDQRKLGYVLYAPPISVSTGEKMYTEDWALVDVHLDKINWNNFKGNVVHLGTLLSYSDYPIPTSLL